MNKPSKYTKFNRHETYTPKMLSMGMKLSNGVASSTVENYIYGLHDGYLYTMLMDVVYLKSEGISSHISFPE